MDLKGIKTRRIAITGIAGGGKTVFLTSLLSHLSEYDQGSELMGNGVELESFYELPVIDRLSNQFPLERYRRLLSSGANWPDKTADHFNYSCEFERSDWRFFKQRLVFFDFPGERAADAAIAVFKDYKDWSKHSLDYYSQHPDYEVAVKDYFSYINKDNLDEKELIHNYKLMLAKLILGYKPLISPSCFLLDSNGRSAKPGTEEQIASLRYSGVGSGFEFAPLSEQLIRKHTAIASSMKRNYSIYRKEVALPVFKRLCACDSIVVLIDIPSLLAGGVGRYNDNRQMLHDLFDVLRDDSWIGSKLLKVLKFWHPKLKRIAFVASKADLVAVDDVYNDRLDSLLRQMSTRATRLLPGVDSGWFVCSACHSTRKGKKDNSLIGQPVHGNPNHEEMEFEVSRLPEHWPAQWQSGEYKFYRVYPNASGNIQIPPESFGLEGIMNFLLS